jgi:hypothetical protein
MENLFTLEDKAMRDGQIGSDFVVAIAVPRRLTPQYLFRRATLSIAALCGAAPSPQKAESSSNVSFDEQFYLDAYADVRKAVAEGIFASGLEHWVRFGQEEGRRGWP